MFVNSYLTKKKKVIFPATTRFFFFFLRFILLVFLYTSNIYIYFASSACAGWGYYNLSFSAQRKIAIFPAARYC